MKYQVKNSGVSVKVAFEPSKYQKPIAEEVVHGTHNIVCDAKAGTGKTTTLKLIVDVIGEMGRVRGKEYSVLLLAFNKAIVEELEKKMPNTIDIFTSHSLGFKIMRDNARRREKSVRLDANKGINILQNLAGKHWHMDFNNPEDAESLKLAKKVGDLGRMNLAQSIDELSTLAKKHDIDLLGSEASMALDYIKQFEKKTGVIDFTDMIYLPYVLQDQLTFPNYDFVLVDESQDLSVAQQTLFQNCMAKDGRFIAVGDPRQSIYGFAGADADAFTNIVNLPNTKVLPLNECYRCGSEIIKFAQAIVPEIEAHPSTGQGVVNEDASVDSIEDGDFVMCRNTMPLVKLCFHFIKRGRAAYIKGRDIGLSIRNLVTKSKQPTLDNLKIWLDGQLVKYLQKLINANPHLSSNECKELPGYVTMSEKHEIIKCIIDDNKDVTTIDSLLRKIEQIFTNHKRGGIMMSTIHQAKGLEADRVFIIERELMPSIYAKQDWQKEQERNLEYVAYTRAKKELNFVSDWSAKRGGGKPAKVNDNNTPSQSEHLGKVGDIVEVKATIINEKKRQSQWGGEYSIFELMTEEGNLATVFGDIRAACYVDDKAIHCKAEVKKLNHFMGNDITVIGKLKPVQ